MRTVLYITLILISVGFVSGCTHHKLINYPMGDGKFNITIIGNSFVSQEDIKNEWYKEASRLCPNGYLVEEIKEKRKFYKGYPKPGLEGVIVCK
tara:strand:+ start:88 stop:369 length:282 start_codon:yes stop_codon:yes gene_type:complete